MRGYGLAIGIAIGVLTATVDSQAREWTDNTGAFRIEAELVGVAGSTVRLKKADGQVIEVPLDRLSEADQQHLRSVRKPVAKNDRAARGSMAERIEHALQQPTTAEFLKTPLEDVAEFLCETSQVLVRLDVRALDDVGIGSDVPIDVSLKAIPLAAVLDGILEPMQLTWVVRDEVVLITTPEEAESHLSPRVYGLRKPINPDQLLGDITRNIAPSSWSRVGGPGTVQLLPPNLLVVAQADAVQRKLAEHYSELLLPIPPAEQFPLPGSAAAAVKAALFQPTQVDFVDAPLKDVIDFLQKQHRITIQLDQRALEDVGIGADVPVTESLKGIQLRSALTFLCRPLELTWTATKAGIEITTPEAAESRPVLEAYRVNDLVPPQGADALIRVVTSTVEPSSWDNVGGPGSLRLGVRGTLDVRQSFGVQMEISRLLEDIRRGRQTRR